MRGARIVGLTFQTAFHAVQCPEEVHRGRPARAQVIALFPQAPNVGFARTVSLHRQDQPHRGGDADGRRAPDTQRANGFPHVLYGVAVAIGQRRRQKRLVDETNVAVGVADPFDAERYGHGIPVVIILAE